MAQDVSKPKKMGMFSQNSCNDTITRLDAKNQWNEVIKPSRQIKYTAGSA